MVMKAVEAPQLTWDELKRLAWQELSNAKYLVLHHGVPIGTKAADVSSEHAVNYDQCFVRDFVPVGLVFLLQRQTLDYGTGTIASQDVVGNFLATTLDLLITPDQMRTLERSPGMMPASFKVENDRIKPDYGERAIARVTPADSCLWWLILLRAYRQAGMQYGINLHPELFEGLELKFRVRRAIRLMLNLYLSHRFDAEPMILVPDGACMIDRRMGLNGYPLEIQALFHAGLLAASDLLPSDDLFQRRIRTRVIRLERQIRRDYWLDVDRLRMLYQAQSEQYGEDHQHPPDQFFNKYNLYQESIPFEHLIQWISDDGGYLVGNLGPSQLDSRFFTLGNLMAILSQLATPEQSRKIIALIHQRWEHLVGEMAMKICYPAIEGIEWHLVTGCDPKNKPWSYHNGGSWPVLMWMLAAAALQVSDLDFIHRLKAELPRYGQRLLQEHWPEYYDGSNGRLIGRMAKRYQTWSIAGFLLAQSFIDAPLDLALVTLSLPERPIR
jgi:Alkaline and neutral invertase